MRTFNSFVVAVIATLIYAFILGYTQDNVHPIVAAFNTSYINTGTAVMVFIFTLTFVRIVFAFGKSGRMYHVMSPKTRQIDGSTYYTVESLEPGKVYEVAGSESRNVLSGHVAISLNTGEGYEAFLVPDQQILGIELGIHYKDRDTAGVQTNDHEISRFKVAYSSTIKKLVLVPADVQPRVAKRQTFVSLKTTKKPIRRLPA